MRAMPSTSLQRLPSTFAFNEDDQPHRATGIGQRDVHRVRRRTHLEEQGDVVGNRVRLAFLDQHARVALRGRSARAHDARADVQAASCIQVPQPSVQRPHAMGSYLPATTRHRC